MSEYELIPTVIAAIVVAAVFVVGTTAIASEIVQTRANLETSNQELNSFAALQLVEGCLRQEGDYIPVEFLDAYAGDDVCELCGFCTVSIRARLTDLETGREWDFGYTGDSDYGRDIFVSITDGGEVHAGRLYAEV